jgi:hypothetical protein
VQARRAGALGQDRDGPRRLALRASAAGRRLNRAHSAGAALLAAALLAGGCESAEEKCGKARGAAAAAWNAYVGQLEQAQAAAKKAQIEANQKLGGEVERRLSPGAQKLADSRYERSDEAWVRAHRAALNEACRQDAECSRLNESNAQAGVTLADLDERLPLARAARDAVVGTGATRSVVDWPAVTKAAADVILHPEYPALKQAQELTRELPERCAGVGAQE